VSRVIHSQFPKKNSSVMNDQVVASNRYSRLMALKKMNVVPDYESITTLTVAIVGIGGVGSVAAEMLARCGIGRLILIDCDQVELANMNRLFYRPCQAGMSKTDAAAQTLREINADVDIVARSWDVCSVHNYDAVRHCFAHGALANKDSLLPLFSSSCCSSSSPALNGPVDLVLTCVDNFSARICVDEICSELGQTWMESGVSEDGVCGHIQLVVPGRTACYQCTPPLIVASGVDERTLKRDGVCAASLPTTMAIVAGLLVQNALKCLLGFGDVSLFQGYGGLANHFPAYRMAPNPECSSAKCVALQQQCRSMPPLESTSFQKTSVGDATEEDEGEDDGQDCWGIELVEQPPTSTMVNDSSNATPRLSTMDNGGVAPPLSTSVGNDNSSASLSDLKSMLGSL
jgi:ubiquitin-like modifier-activating enzyme 5